ncbi:hypothetical protein EWW49_26025 [Pseudomonas syringae]|uniref:TULIP family P47-like protein n=1 Tax=Pseudomonas sp. MWU16-30316 TaxID=2878093 RepID=UPI001105584F|nr:TULIP family P47-like protein [Pseudomonas sp. MWU16-30316]TFZ34285.1 hypothetical protein EWW49_26025 [Pseudomonas syringae]
MGNTYVDTNGWDCVSAIKYSDVNKAIINQKSSPTTFSQAAPDGQAAVSGTFGDWLLTLGGAGKNIYMSVPIKSGTFKMGTEEIALNPCTATIEVHAQFLPQPTDTAKKNLVLVTDSASSPAVTVSSVLPAQTDYLANAVLSQLLGAWFNANLQEFNHVFAVADFNAQLDTGLEWLTPSLLGYAVAEPELNPTLENSVFGVLTLIDGSTDTSGLSLQVSPFSIPDKSDAGFLLSPQVCLTHMILASTPLMFKGITDTPPSQNFKIDASGTRIINTNDLTLVPTKLENGKVVTPTVSASNFTLQIDTTELVINISDMQFEFSPGINVHLNYEGRQTLNYDAEHDILGLTVSTQSGSGSVVVSEGFQIANIVLGVVAIVTAIVGGVGGAISKAATSAVTSATEAAVTTAEAEGEAATATVSILKGIISGTPQEMSQLGGRFAMIAKCAMLGSFLTGTPAAIMGIVDAVANLKYDEMPKISDLTNNAIGKAVVWPAGTPSFKLASAQLNGSCQFGLTYSGA